MIKKPYISVIIPLYNKELIVERSVRSVLDQSFSDFELIIVDDGSIDNSFKIVSAINDERIRLFQQENGGPSKARNTGIRNSQGEWIVFIDADDEMLPDALECFCEYINRCPDVDMFVGEVYIQNEYERYIVRQNKDGFVKNVFKAYMNNLFTPCSGAVIYKAKKTNNNLFNEKIWRFEDLERLFRLFKTIKLYLIPQAVVNVNCQFAAASGARKDISEDFVGHIDILNKSFWEKLSYYRLFLEEHSHYPEQSSQLYPHLFKRYDLYLLCTLMNIIKKHKWFHEVFLCVIGSPVKSKLR